MLSDHIGLGLGLYDELSCTQVDHERLAENANRNILAGFNPEIEIIPEVVLSRFKPTFYDTDILADSPDTPRL